MISSSALNNFDLYVNNHVLTSSTSLYFIKLPGYRILSDTCFKYKITQNNWYVNKDQPTVQTATKLTVHWQIANCLFAIVQHNRIHLTYKLNFFLTLLQ